MLKSEELDGTHTQCAICVTFLCSDDLALCADERHPPEEFGDIQGHMVSIFVTINRADRRFCNTHLFLCYQPALALRQGIVIVDVLIVIIYSTSLLFGCGQGSDFRKIL